MWIFGYGSLIWKPGFTYTDKQTCYIENWERRFYQKSEQARGSKEKPGFVATIFEEKGAKTWGVSYRVKEEEQESVLSQLEDREQCGYQKQEIKLFTKTSSSSPWNTGITFVGAPSSRCFVGPLEDEEIASVIAQAHGESGSNREYLFRLFEVLQSLGVEDPHVISLTHQVRTLLEEAKQP